MKTVVTSMAALLCLAFASSAGADETFDILPVGSVTYTNVTVTDVTVTDVYFTYPGGMGNAKLKDLSPALQQHFHYNQANALVIEDKQAQANIQYHALIAQQAAAHPPDVSRLPASSAATQTDGQWGTDLPTALNQARSQNKLVFLDFTGSDWCPWCIKFTDEVLATPQFAAYAQNKLVLVKLDFPHNIAQSDDLKRANQELHDRYNVNGFPTYILLDASGKELGRQVGYRSGGPDAFIAELDGFGK
jgi:thioredoxin-related protein